MQEGKQVEALEGPTADTAPIEDTAAPDTTDVFPAGSRVEVQWGDNQWWKGTVVRTYVSRTMPRERVIVVKYDDTRWTGTFSHGLLGSPVRLLKEKEKQVHVKPSEDPRVDAEQRQQKRLARLARQLGI